MAHWSARSVLTTANPTILRTYRGLFGLTPMLSGRSDELTDTQGQQMETPEPPASSCSSVVRPQCALLELPAELRNHIFQLSFMEPPSVDFLDAEPPSKALTLTCRHIHAETALMYKAAYRSFWTETEFTIDLFHQLAPPSECRSLTPTIRPDTALKNKVYRKIYDMDIRDLSTSPKCT